MLCTRNDRHHDTGDGNQSARHRSTAHRAFAEPMFAAAIVGNCICIGAGDTKIPSVMNFGSMWLIRLSLAAYLAPKYGLAGVWSAMAIELTFRGIIFLIRIYRGKWMNHKVSVDK